ncbi:hypothetical protein [Bacillus massilioanorexius]|uniref:hypothetical protein n=1 Tax=Bacillus massilioanorexius TaxID=1468413 RepID=UPI0011DE32D6|nr:hypothetical protein [Bacillus massilioanorexius]
MIISIPTFVIDNTIQQSINGYNYYLYVLAYIQILLIYYLFVLIIEFAQRISHQSMLQTTKLLFKWYISIMLISLLLQSFVINLPSGWQIIVSFISVISAFIMQIVLIIYLAKMISRCPDKVNNCTFNA